MRRIASETAAPLIFDGDRWMTPERLAREQRLFDAASWRVNAAASLLGITALALIAALLAAVLSA